MKEDGIEKLRLSEEIEDVLKKNNILKIKQLIKTTRKMLRGIGLASCEVSEIELKLQLEGFDLKGNY